MSKTSIQYFDVIVEVPRWGFVKRGSRGDVDFVSPLPCPYNYGAVPRYLGLDGDLLDAVIIGPRLRRGMALRLPARGAIGLMDRGLYDDKIVFSEAPLSSLERMLLLHFFRIYARFKQVLNMIRGRPGMTACTGWCDLDGAIARAELRDSLWGGPSVTF
jgi:inorganic pyrophosphatase